MSLVNNSMLRLSAYLVREACGLDDHEPVMLNVGAESVREMAIDALREHDKLRAIVRDLGEYISQKGKCAQADSDEDLCAYSDCGYCLVAGHINQLEAIADD